MKILVVGGAGYIGSHVCKSFLEDGHEIFVFDNLSTGLRQNILPGSHFVGGDILDRPKLLETCKSVAFDGLVHLAALKAAGESMHEPGKYADHNITGTINLLNCAVDTGIACFVFSSSAAVYGNPKKLPLDESHPTNPVNFYGFTKLNTEFLLNWYYKLKGIKFAALRYFNAAGYDPKGELTGLEHTPQNLIPVVMETAMGRREKLQIFGNDYDTPDGTCIRDYIHVSDLATAHVMAMRRLAEKMEPLTLNLGSEGGASVLEILAMAREVTGMPIPNEIVPRRTGDPAQLYASAGKARQILGWQARHSSLKSIMESTWKAYQANQ